MTAETENDIFIASLCTIQGISHSRLHRVTTASSRIECVALIVIWAIRLLRRLWG